MNFIKGLKKLFKYPIKDQIMAIRIFAYTGVARFAMLKIPFKILKKYMGVYKEESEQEIDKESFLYIKKVRNLICSVSKYTPWESKCLVQALVAQKLLKEKGLRTTLYLGVGLNEITQGEDTKENNMLAHSWIRCGNLYVTGGDGHDFATVAKFSK